MSWGWLACLNVYECFTGKCTTCKIHTRRHLGPYWHIFHIFSSGDSIFSCHCIAWLNLVPRLSFLPPFVIGRKTLVAAGYMTTQNLGGKNTCWAGWVAKCFECCCANFVGFQPRAVAKNHPLNQGLMWCSALEECYIISAVSKI